MDAYYGVEIMDGLLGEWWKMGKFPSDLSSSDILGKAGRSGVLAGISRLI